MDNSLFVLLALPLCGLLCSTICYLKAEQKHRNPLLWLLMGFATGPIAIMLIILIDENLEEKSS